MPDLITVSARSLPPARGRLTRMWRALRSSWSGPFTLKDPALNQLFGLGARSAAGPVVTEHTAFACSAVFDAVNQISADVAKLPLNLLKRRQDGGSEPFTTSRTYKLLKFNPNPEMTSMVFRRTMQTHVLIAGNAYAEIERDEVGRPFWLWPLEPHRVQVVRDTGRLQYVLDGGKATLAPMDVLHLRGLGWDGILGFDMVQLAREAIGLALASERFASAFFGNGTRFGGILMSDQDLDEDQENELRDKLEKLYARADKAFRLLVLGAGFKFEQAGVKPSEAQMKEIRDQQVQEVARFYNMPLHKLKNLDRATNNNIEHQDLEYYKGCLLNWITLWEQELGAKLIPSLELGQQYFKHNANAFLRGDIKSRYEALGIARDKGIINADEWREFEDMNPQPDGQGQIYLVQAAQIPVDRLIAKVDAEIDKLNEPPAPPPTPAPEPAPADGEGDAARTALVAEIETLRVRLAASEATAAEAQRLAETARDSATTSAEEKATAAAHAAHLEALTVDLRAQLQTSEAALVTRDEIVAVLQAEQAATQAAIAAAQARQQALEADVSAATVAVEDAKAAADAARAIAAARTQDTTTLTAERDSALAALEIADTLAQSAEQAQETARAEASAAARESERLRAEMEAARARLTEVEAAFAALQASARAKQLATLTAHRGLIVDALGRMTRREVQQARAKQATPEKLRRWLGGFPALHEAICVEALVPAMRTHLAWKGTEADPVAATTALVREHIGLFVRTLEAVLKSEPDEFHAELDRVLTRWEAERAAAVADQVLLEEIRHAAA